MKLYISKGSGSGPTELSAFDAALLEAGVGNLNLIPLSSVIPIAGEIIHSNPDIEDKDFGSKLYCVLSEQRTSIPNEEVWAGIGWVQEPRSKRGLFVEHHGHSEASVRRDIKDSLSHMVADRPEFEWGNIEMVVKGVTCTDKPVCSLVVVSYSVEGWSQNTDY